MLQNGNVLAVLHVDVCPHIQTDMQVYAYKYTNLSALQQGSLEDFGDSPRANPRAEQRVRWSWYITRLGVV